MRPTRTSHPIPNRHRQIGRKVMQADRLAHALSSGVKESSKAVRLLPFMRPKMIAIAVIIVVAVSTLGVSTSRFYSEQASANQKAQLAEQQIESKAKSAAADACRRTKADQKSDQIGKVTFDELYDYDECDK